MKKIIALLWLTLLAMVSTVNVQADEAFRKHRYDSWKVMGLPEGAIVFAGNSITDMHNWVEAFGNDQRIVNRGNSGGYSYEVLDNVESWVRFKPAKVFIKIGTNDLGTSYTEQSIAANIQKTVDIIRNESPDTKIYLQSILPAKDQAYKTLTTIQVANVLIRQIAEATANCTYIDLYSKLGGIRSGGSYSADNLHLKAYGYKIWCETILTYLNEGNTGATFSCVYPSNTETSQNMGGLGGSHGMRATYFSVQPITSNDILFFGDEMVKNGEWNELLKNANVKNRGTGWGYGGDIATTSGLVDATFASVSGVSKAAPSKILLYTGTGDVNGTTDLATVESNYQALITKLQQKALGTPIYLVSLMPRSSANQRIIDFNTWLQSKADGSSIYYIDIYTALASNGKANGNYFSGDYIYGMGYVKVAQELAKHIDGCTALTEEQATANKQVFEARTALNTAVNKAKSLRIGTGIGEYPQSVETTLASAITTAYAVLANTDATEANLTSATNTFNTVLNAQLLNINKPTTNKNYTIKASFSSGAKGRYLVNNNGTLSAYTYLPGGYSALWTYTGSGFKSAADPTQHLYVSGGFGLNTSTHTLDINVGLTEGTVAIAEDTRNAAINKDGTVSGGQYTGKQCNENGGWTTDFVLEEVEGEIPAPEVSAPTFSAINLLNTQTGWYQIADYMNANSQATSDPALLTAYADEVTVNSNKYPAGFSVKKTATSVDELVKTFVYVTKTGSNNTNTNNINLQTANGRYMTYDGTSSLTASQIYQIYFTSSQKTRIVMSSGSSGNDRHSWIPQTSNAVNYVGYATNGQFPSYQFSVVDLDALNLKAYTVKAVGTAEDVQVTYNGTDNYGLDKVYNNGVFFFGIDAYPTASDFSASVANATITVGDGVIYVDGVQSTKVFETPASGTPYRIPAVAQAKNGDLVFVSDYRYSKADIGMANNGKLDLRFRKKYADGHWGDVKTLAACIESPTFTAFGDPCIVCDQSTGKIMVTSCCGNVSYPNGTHSNHQGWSRWYSEDNGETWSSTYVDLSEQVMNQIDKRTGAKLASFFIGSGKISQSKTVKVGEYYRLYCASLTRVSPDGTGTGAQTMNYVWYSDDFGVTWKMLGTADGNPINGGNEPKADELPDGSVLISSRTGGGRIYNIYHYTDTKAAKGYWGSQVNSNANNNGTFGADCNGEILVVPVTRASDNQKTYLLLQSIPAASDRRNVGIYYKELTDLSKYRTPAELAANNWTLFPISYTTSAYSTMCQMENNHIAFFYEENDHNSGYDMVFKEFSIETITGNAYSYGELTESEKNTYLTNGVDPYFNTHNYGDETIISLAAAYKTSPTTSNYDALNAAVQDYFNVNVAGEYIRLRNCQYNTYMNANGTAINGINDGTGNGTLWYVEDNGEGGLKLKNVGTGTYMGNITQSKAVTLSADNTTTFEFEMLDNGHVVFKQQNGGNYQYGHIDSSNKLVGWEKSAGATQWELIEVVEVPSSTLSLEPNSQVTVSELSALTITFKGSNAANVKLSEIQHTAYLTKKTAPAHVKAQNGKFNAPRLKAAGETPEGIPGEISATDETGKFSIAFDKDAIEAGDYELSIPSGTFYVENDENLATPVPALTANYTVGEAPAPVDDINTPIAYGHLPGATPVDTQWTAWEGEVRDGITAINATKYTASNLWYIEKTYTFTEGQSLSAIFKWSGNASVDNKRTDVIGVELLNADGSVAYSQYHAGSTGSSDSNNSYTINGIAAGTYNVRYIATTAESQCQTGGTITNVLWDVPVNGKVYTVYNDHLGVPYYVSKNQTKQNGFQDITSDRVTDGSQEWIACYRAETGYTFYNLADNSITLHAANGSSFDYEIVNKLVGVSLYPHGTATKQAGNRNSLTLKGGTFSISTGTKNVHNEVNYSWSTDFVFNFTGEYAYKVQTEEGQTVTFNDVDFENGDFIIVDEQLTDATGFEASAKTGYKSEIAVDATNYTIAVTYSNVTTVEVTYNFTVDGKSIGSKTITETVGAAPTKDYIPAYVVINSGMPETITAETPSCTVETSYDNTVPFTVGNTYFIDLWGQSTRHYLLYSNGTNVNETKQDQANADVTSYKDTPSYKWTVGGDWFNGFTFKNGDGYYMKAPTANPENGTALIVTKTEDALCHFDLKASGASSGKYTYTPHDGSNNVAHTSDNSKQVAFYNAYTGGNLEATTFTYIPVEDTPAEVPATGYYYIKESGKYLYNDQSVGTVTQKSDSYDGNFNNRYIWHITNDGNGNLTLLNGEGKGYKANESAEEITSLGETDFLSLQLVTSPVELTSDYKWVDVVVRYADGMMTYTHGENATQYVANGGFFALYKTNRSDGDISYTPVDGFKAASISDETRYEEESDIRVSYYTQETEDKVHDMQVRIMDWVDHLNCVGYPTYETIFEDQYMEDYVQVSSSVIGGLDVPFSPGDYFDVEEAFNRMCAISDVIMPEIGDAYTLAVRSKNGSKHYLVEGGGLTTDKSQASVFVLGTSGNAGHDYLLATNDNEQSHYLQYKGATSKTYSANTCDIKFDAMVGTGSNANINASMIQRVGTFAIQTAARPDDAALVGTLTVKEDGSTWDKSKEPFMNDSFTSAIEMEVVDYPYTHPTLASGTGDGHEGVFASVWLPFPMNIPDGIEVYKGTQERDVKGNPYLGLTQVNPDENSCYAKGGYILYSSDKSLAGQQLVLPANSVPNDQRDYDEDAAFAGSTENPELYKHTDEWGDEIPGDTELWTAFKNAHTDSTPYVLANKSAGIGFYKYTGTTYPKGKAIWMKPATDNDSEVVKLGFGDIITAIEALHGNTKNAEIFDLQGRRLDKVEKGKVNVINGQKIMFK